MISAPIRILFGSLLGLWIATVVAAESPQSTPGFRFVEEPEKGILTLYENDRPVLAYNFGDQLKPGVSADRKRSCYVHPIYGLDGEILTDDFPGDHHHRGLCGAWAHAKIDGKTTDPWDLRGLHTRFRRWIQRQSSADGAVLAVENAWVLDDGSEVASETFRLRVHKASEIGRAVDIQWRITAADKPIEIAGRKDTYGGAGYGGLMLRFRDPKNAVLTTDQGRQPDSNHKAFAWADLSSQFGGSDKMSGAAIFVHPDHTDAPVGWTLRHYGFLNPAWPGVNLFTLQPGKPLTLNYRLWVHRGDANSGSVRQAYKAYLRTVGSAGSAKPSETTKTRLVMEVQFELAPGGRD